jgi:hypothetical protein
MTFKITRINNRYIFVMSIKKLVLSSTVNLVCRKSHRHEALSCFIVIALVETSLAHSTAIFIYFPQ